jgi:hypothetical protein
MPAHWVCGHEREANGTKQDKRLRPLSHRAIDFDSLSANRKPPAPARNASFDHARRYAVLAGQLFRGGESFGPAELAAQLSISAFRAKFGLRVIRLSAVRGGEARDRPNSMHRGEIRGRSAACPPRLGAVLDRRVLAPVNRKL